MKRSYFALLIIVIFTLLIGCNKTEQQTGSTANQSNSQAGKKNTPDDASKANNQELIVVGQEIAASLDPVKPLTSSYLRLIGAGEALFKVNAKGGIEPELAESAKEVDPTTWEIKLKTEPRFWSGKNIDADAVIASLERSRALDLQALPFLKELTFDKADDRTILVKTTREHVPVPLNLSYYQTLIHNVEAKQDAVSTMDLSGMYKVVEFFPKQRMVLERNESYWRAKPAIRRIVFEEMKDEQTRVLASLSGRGQVVLNIPAASLAQFKSNAETTLSASPAANTQTVYLNLRQPQLADVKVRQALSWALNREELVTLAAEGQSFPVATWLSSNPAYAEARNAIYAKPDPAKAGQLLDEAGWSLGTDGVRYKDGKPLTLRLRTWGGDKALGEALQSQWTQIGVKTEVQHGDYSLIETARGSGDWDASIEAWSTFGEEFALLTGQFSPKGSANYGGYDDAQTNELLSKLEKASSDAARRELALQINERVAQQAPAISLFPRPQITAISKSLQGFEAHFRQFENVVNANLSLVSK
ncbi:peptide/nickel transport system substrate-binding protein [Paenibacillus sp. UNCCL117]|uniref:ABC transporter substrate-binding protein n=1 Tax=unclassified Paenibacillus TaxID=185978 RepID=UPI00088D4A32|nr:MULTISPECIES: ABC transporter substrate-binding protein [unclassified Paenibacillus]SDC89753.1 peptide/nickel transport system substrate-binding protein [Paenibacillus sp. cl123]SFW28641.1 peptide/nickel transport system substrate-binding protein [Paenibacillus sp. UNCCL117]